MVRPGRDRGGRWPLRWIVPAACALCLLLSSLPASAAGGGGSLLLWPTRLEIPPDRQAVGLWLENRGASVLHLQVRVLDWTQEEGENQYARQTLLVATPPMIAIDPGARRMVRLSLLAPVPAGSERAFRVLVDEIPAAVDADRTLGVRFQFRYSLPLFARGPGFDAAAEPELRWRVVRTDEGAWLQVDNAGRVHARLSDVGFAREGAHADGGQLLGYVLAGRAVRLALPEGRRAGAELWGSVNGAPRVLLPAAE